MDGNISGFLLGLIPSIITAVIVFYFQRRQNRKDKEAEERAEARKRESYLGLKLQMATAKLSFATARAIQRGHANGEVEEGIAEYETAKKDYYNFLNEHAKEHLTK